MFKNTPFVVFSKAWVQNQGTKTSFAKFRSATIAVSLGVFVAILIMYAMGSDGFGAFGAMMGASIKSSQLQNTLGAAALYLVSAIANLIAFRSGLFNIGVSGQMFFSGMIVIIFGTKVLANAGVGGLILLIIIAMISGALLTAFMGWIKVKFNIHEVISSILLNSGLFFLGRYILKKIPDQIQFNSPASFGTIPLDSSYRVYKTADELRSWGWIVFVGFGVSLALIVAFIFWKTRLGFNLKAVGLNGSAAENAGINRRRQIILAMTLSGAVAGVAAVLFFVFSNNRLQKIPGDFFTAGDLAIAISEGFDGIAIALIAFNSSLGAIPVSFFFAMLKNGSTTLNNYNLDTQVYSLILGFVMYFAAVALIFMRFRIFQMFYAYWKLRRVKEVAQFKQEFKTSLQEQKQFWKNEKAKILVQRRELRDKKKNKHDIKANLQNSKSEDRNFKVILKSFVDKTFAQNSSVARFKSYSILRKHYKQKVHIQKLKVILAYESRISKYAALVRTEEYEKLRKSFVRSLPANSSASLITRMKFRFRPMTRKSRLEFASAIDKLLEGGKNV